MSKRHGNTFMTEDPLAPARGCAFGLIAGTFCWAVIFAVLKLVLP